MSALSYSMTHPVDRSPATLAALVRTGSAEALSEIYDRYGDALMGVAFRRASVSLLFTQLRPWMLTGFAVMFLTGGLLFSARATEAFNSFYFRTKMALLLLGGLNVVLFHLTVDRRRDEWDRQLPPPAAARVAGGVSLCLWFAIIAAGRIMAYNL